MAAPDPLLLEITDHPRVGGKARSLAQLAAAGLRTPAGFVVGDALFGALRAGGPPLPTALDSEALEALARAAAALVAAPLPEGFVPALQARLGALGASRFSVRSSFAGEDEAGALGAGVFASRVDVPADAVPDALREVLASALRPGALAYALAHGRAAATPPVAVLVHAYAPADAAGTVASDGRDATAPVTLDVRAGGLAVQTRALLEQTTRRLAAARGPVEIEWAAMGAKLTFLQLRPYRAPSPARPWPALAALPAGEAQRWHWDAAHNPLALSPAQAGLVALADASCRIGIRQRVLGGYLFWAPDGPVPAAPPIDPAALPAALATLAREVEAALAALAGPADLEQALALFLSVYERLFGLVQPAARRGRAGLESLLTGAGLDAAALLPGLLADVASRASERERGVRSIALATGEPARAAAIADYLARFGDEAPIWDLACPTYRERPEALLTAAARPPARVVTSGSWQVAAREVAARLPAEARASWDEVLAIARACAAAGEDDDWLYARVQAAVRRALLALGERLASAGALPAAADVFFLPLETARALGITGGASPEPVAVAALATQGRAAHAAASADPPPLVGASAGTAGGPVAVVRGAGSGGRALGRVVLRHGPLGAAPAADAVLVATSLLPTELPLLQVAALVTETGGPLGHVAAQARERGLPAVVDAAGATTALADGDLVLVDADAGLVIRCGPRA